MPSTPPESGSSPGLFLTTRWSVVLAAQGGEERAEAKRIVAQHPKPSPAEMERARTVLAPLLDAAGDLHKKPFDSSRASQIIALGVGGYILGITAFFSLICAPLLRGGALLRGLGIAVVRADGTDVSRRLMLWGVAVAWAWMPLGAITALFLARFMSGVMAVATVAIVTIAVTVWSAIRRDRSIPDQIAGTHLVPR